MTCSGLYLRAATIIGSVGLGAVRLVGAHVVGDFDSSGAELRNDSGPALHGHGLRVDQYMFLANGFTATGGGEGGAVHLPGAHVGELYCVRARMRNDSGPAFAGDGLQVDKDFLANRRFTAWGGGLSGAVRLVGAHIGGQLDFSEAELRNDSYAALHADGLLVDREVILADGFAATGSGDAGAVSLVSAHIGGRLLCSRAHLRNDSGPALWADGLYVGHDMYFANSSAIGSSQDGVFRLLNARIDGDLSFAATCLRNDAGPALAADSARMVRLRKPVAQQHQASPVP
jgi:hypothetical protein